MRKWSSLDLGFRKVAHLQAQVLHNFGRHDETAPPVHGTDHAARVFAGPPDAHVVPVQAELDGDAGLEAEVARHVGWHGQAVPLVHEAIPVAAQGALANDSRPITSPPTRHLPTSPPMLTLRR